MSQVVDTPTAKELMQEALQKISETEQSALADDLEKKSRHFQSVLGRKEIDSLDHERLKSLLRSIFSTRRKATAILEQYPIEVLRPNIQVLLYGTAAIQDRFESFCFGLEGIDGNIRFDLASELLHFTQPDRYWLWTRWMWDPKTKTGSLPLVIMDDFTLHRDTIGSTYVRIGEAVTFINDVGQAAGFQRIARGLFGTDVYLACVYGVYLYTVLKMRMTQEFNKVMPQMPELAARLLGTHRMDFQLHTKSLASSGGEEPWA